MNKLKKPLQINDFWEPKSVGNQGFLRSLLCSNLHRLLIPHFTCVGLPIFDGHKPLVFMAGRAVPEGSSVVTEDTHLDFPVVHAIKHGPNLIVSHHCLTFHSDTGRAAPVGFDNVEALTLHAHTREGVDGAALADSDGGDESHFLAFLSCL